MSEVINNFALDLFRLLMNVNISSISKINRDKNTHIQILLYSRLFFFFRHYAQRLSELQATPIEVLRARKRPIEPFIK